MVVGYIIADALDQNIIADFAIVDGGIVDAGRHGNHPVADHDRVGCAEAYPA